MTTDVLADDLGYVAVRVGAALFFTFVIWLMHDDPRPPE